MTKKAVILHSGGLDSTTCIAIARDQGYACHALSVSYGQRHAVEIDLAAEIAASLGCVEHRVVTVDVSQFGGSALTDSAIDVPTEPSQGIPVTYVPARNTLMLSIALGWAEVLGAQTIFIGVNAVDYSGYPDCRPEFIEAFNRLARQATKVGIEGRPIEIQAPLVNSSKAEIIQMGIALGVDYGATISCYQPNDLGAACRVCEACRLRREGFQQAGVSDPTNYQSDVGQR